MKLWYEAFFENYGNTYEKEPYTKGTKGECDFIEKEVGYKKGIKILDIGCGTGRHAIELATRGYQVTGVDLSDSMIQKARQNAKQQQAHVIFEKHDARVLPYTSEFDLAIMLCGGAFPLMETDEMNYRILENASKALKQKNSKLIFATLNGLFPLFHSVKDFINSKETDTSSDMSTTTFDLMTFRQQSTITFVDDDGEKKELQCDERYYVPSEIRWLLNSLGFINIDIYGAKLGAFSREDPLTTEDFEMLIIAEK
ncbi:MAG TPA: class I SAM-dependent methyltransferase [Thermoplasmata archaeon]|jgi:SAM-dependent methyltransferase|nr:MAG TPA: class I SAM-dependent methyltransferase [Thermoplasmata archaeon]